jgi:hypothetical protein
MMLPDSTYQMNIETFSIIWKPMEIAAMFFLEDYSFTPSQYGRVF